MKIRILILVGIALCVSSTILAQGERVKKCSVPKGGGGKYKVVSEAYTLGEPKKLLLDVVVKPQNFDGGYLIAFARRIKAEYCNEEHLLVAIYDSKKAIAGAHYDYVVSGGKLDRKRGVYILNRKTGDEGIDFSTKPGNPVNEISIDLSKSN